MLNLAIKINEIILFLPRFTLNLRYTPIKCVNDERLK